MWNTILELKFDDAGMGDLSAKAIRNILPLMSNGYNITPKAEKRIQSLLQLNNSEEEKVKRDNRRKTKWVKNL